MDHVMMLGVDNIDVGAVQKQVSKFPTYSPGGATLFVAVSDDDTQAYFHQ